MSPKLWNAIKIDDPSAGDYIRKRIRRKFPTIRPPDHRLDEVEPISEVVNIMQEAPVGEQACIGKRMVIIKRRKVKVGGQQ
jgi:hypothetical protein